MFAIHENTVFGCLPSTCEHLEEWVCQMKLEVRTGDIAGTGSFNFQRISLIVVIYSVPKALELNWAITDGAFRPQQTPGLKSLEGNGTQTQIWHSPQIFKNGRGNQVWSRYMIAKGFLGGGFQPQFLQNSPLGESLVVKMLNDAKCWHEQLRQFLEKLQ